MVAYQRFEPVRRADRSNNSEKSLTSSSDSSTALTPTRGTYLGIFLLALVTLMYELVLTRVFSVSMWYHFAFMAISVAMFGMTVGAVIVYLKPQTFTVDKIYRQLALFSLLYGLSIFAATQIELWLPDMVSAWAGDKIAIPYLIATYPVVSIPFVLSGICISLLLTRFEKHVGRLYAFDLMGAAVGCVLLIALLNIVDAFTAIIFMAAMAVSAGFCFIAASEKDKMLRTVTALLACALAGMGLVRLSFGADQIPVLQMKWVKFQRESPPLFEKWNSFSRITVHGNPKAEQAPFGWSMSPVYKPDLTVNRLDLHIDGNAKTVLSHFDGDIAKLGYLKFDMVNLGHMMRDQAKVLVIGVGAGRDILSALAFDQKSVLGVEVNGVILSALNNTFGDFSGHLDKNPKVHFAVDEARSYIARSGDNFDIIQISVIDTLAATASGAFVFTENSLYTIESWKVFLTHLSDRGVLSVSRWYHRGMPAESYRITDLAVEALEQMGVDKPRNHILMARLLLPHGAESDLGVSTILVSKTAYTEEDVKKFENICHTLHFDILLTPTYAADVTFGTIGNGGDLKSYLASLPLNVAAPTDDNPYFFHMLRMKDVFNPHTWASDGENTALAVYGNKIAVIMLAVILLTVIILTGGCIIIPLLTASKRSIAINNLSLTLFFSAIGLGFMCIEVSQMQRLIVMLGHPIYGLSVVLFSLLLASGLGSFTTQAIRDEQLQSKGLMRLVALLVILVLSGLVTPPVVTASVTQSNVVRILLSVLTLVPMGFFMGMAFPLGMRIALKRSPSLSPWLWGINGATSVLASVLSMCISLEWGISATFWLGCVFYAIALATFRSASHSPAVSSP